MDNWLLGFRHSPQKKNVVSLPLLSAKEPKLLYLLDCEPQSTQLSDVRGGQLAKTFPTIPSSNEATQVGVRGSYLKNMQEYAYFSHSNWYQQKPTELEISPPPHITRTISPPLRLSGDWMGNLNLSMVVHKPPPLSPAGLLSEKAT